ncbi:Bug family tripartite tricarboxylate transporter substrate binding protein [Ancylobacter mangrovi]|uniref:Tripartite tricarboxylate transporter substrate-binding protein n=1 Tax=Ancylobacter mangrovi TaxID=2972472 RepID=A0A9X2T318_9HYPH|nr:tripartite tricarboxylate transporter substrate-binding protein [Ancylobacter mangrovi]MCS0496552.1 tripartite tricarboxylate transporter substrate-binding protein [Ancylobacter mangrovi]MCS0503723.1 tripartite tricarboxylate transporter substrate-binding protein [Ancylobacter mangrovi]
MTALLGVASCLALATTHLKAETVEEFYKGKQIRAIIGYSVGGGYDTYTRLLAAHLGKHIPGNPTVVPENMPGAGSLKAANYLFNVAPKDGTVIGTFARGLPMEPLIGGSATHFDASAFSWLGSISDEASVCVTGANSKVTSWDQAKTTEFTVAGEGSGSDPDIFATMLKNLFDVKMRLITGYPGTNEMTMAIERSEVDGRCGWSWAVLKATKADELKNNKLHVILQLSLREIKDLPDVPNVMAITTTEKQREVLRLVLARQVIGRPYAAPPGIPKDRLEALRKAFDETMKDPAFLADAEKAGLEVDPVSGAEVEDLIRGLYALPKDEVAKARSVIVE